MYLIRGLPARVCAAVLLACASARAVVVATNPGSSNTNGINDVQPGSIPYWGNVGSRDLGGSTASAVYIGKGWALTAAHVGPGTVVFGGSSYTWDGQETRLTDPSNGQPTDMIVFHLSGNTGLPQLSLAYTTPAANSTYYNVGFGLDRNTALSSYNASFQTSPGPYPYQGFGLGSSRMTWGSNTVYNFGSASNPVTLQTSPDGYGNVTTFAGVFNSSSDQLVSGDSGGAAFDSSGRLVGMNVAEGTYANQPGTLALYNNASYMMDIATYYNQIYTATGVPEPASTALLGLVAAPLLLRRTRGA